MNGLSVVRIGLYALWNAFILTHESMDARWRVCRLWTDNRISCRVKRCRGQILENDRDVSNFDSWENKEQIEFGHCLLPFNLESFIIPSTALLTYLLSWALPEKLPIVQPIRNFPAILRYPKVHHRTHKSPPPVVGPLSPRHGASSGCGWRERPPEMEGSCEYIE
jgi:hypothetical protein